MAGRGFESHRRLQNVSWANKVMRRLLVIVAGGLGAVLLAAGGWLFVETSLGLSMGGIPRDQAIYVARQHVQSAVDTMEVGAVPGPFLFFRRGSTDAVSPWYRMVWSITFEGAFAPASCGPSPPSGQATHCPPPQHRATVIVDYSSGEFIQASYGP